MIAKTQSFDFIKEFSVFSEAQIHFFSTFPFGIINEQDLSKAALLALVTTSRASSIFDGKSSSPRDTDFVQKMAAIENIKDSTKL